MLAAADSAAAAAGQSSHVEEAESNQLSIRCPRHRCGPAQIERPSNQPVWSNVAAWMERCVEEDMMALEHGQGPIRRTSEVCHCSQDGRSGRQVGMPYLQFGIQGEGNNPRR
eukprot:TRINITY_DN5735_c2_g2_i1.p1 TRINITY_DN5735_c2_g2~~TRINITY_DN5735_c2_g2_i1.p1  ORF type:complete len:112 (-),score=0.28 TRINITY_DN5735_c2_g2_i1:276-611(-)